MSQSLEELEEEWYRYIRDVVIIPVDPEFSPVMFFPEMFKTDENRKRWQDAFDWMGKVNGGCWEYSVDGNWIAI